MKEKIREILVRHSDNKNANDKIEAELLDLFSVIDSFDIDGSELSREDQLHLQRLFWDGKVKIKIGL